MRSHTASDRRPAHTPEPWTLNPDSLAGSIQPAPHASACRSGVWVQGLVWGVVVYCSGFRVSGFGFRVQGSGYRVWGVGFKLWGESFRAQG